MKDHDPDHAHSSLIKTPKQLIIVILLSFLVPIISIILLTQFAVSGKAPSPEALQPEIVAQRIKPVADVVISGSAEASAEQAAAAAAPAPAAPVAVAAAGDTGEGIYQQACAACHGHGVMGAPKLGDKADWQPRLAQGKDTLYKHAIGGFTGAKGMMPPKGGNASLSDAQVHAAVDYMAGAAK
ncbi:MAG TPA: c-type cytochrome [Burkholderiales bacterium]